MCEIIDEITKSNRIVEWIDPWDVRLEHATGQPAPQGGGADRTGWEVRQKDWPILASAVKRLIVPELVAVDVTAEVEGDEDWSTVILKLPSAEHWAQSFPANDLTNVLTVRGVRRWAAVAITDNHLGLAVFALEEEKSVTAKVQSIPNDTLQRIMY